MRFKNLILSLVFHLLFLGTSYANDSLTAINGMVSKMKAELSLTEDQVVQVKPILKRSMIKRQDLMDTLEGDPLINKKSVRMKLRIIREEENKELGGVLSKEQMDKLLSKQRLRDSLNKDQIDFFDGYGDMTLNPQGGSFRF